jgi:hypothetical protein
MKAQLISLLEHEFGVDYSVLESRFSIEAAIYWFASDWYDGQADPLYSVLCQSRYKPSCLCRGVENEDDDLARDMYDYLQSFVNNRGILRLPVLEV